MYDAIVIGSRCAGAPTAMLLARQGRRVLLVDRATFPSDVLSGHTIQPAGVARLARWGLLDRVRATGVPVRLAVRFDFGAVVLEGAPVPVDGIDAGVCIRRTVLDTLLADAAAEAGAEVRLGFTRHRAGPRGRPGRRHPGPRRRRPPGRGAGVGRRRRRRRQQLRRPRGRRRRLPRRTRPRRSPSTRTGAASTSTRIELYARPGRFFVATPTNDGLTLVAQQVPDRRGPAATATGPPTPSPRRWPRCPASPHGSPRGERVERFRFARTPRLLPAAAPARDGRSSATPATTRTRSPPRACSTRSATPSCSPEAIDDGLDGDLDAEWRATSGTATRRPCRCTS